MLAAGLHPPVKLWTSAPRIPRLLGFSGRIRLTAVAPVTCVDALLLVPLNSLRLLAGPWADCSPDRPLAPC